jgi:putative DNA primase/helicase
VIVDESFTDAGQREPIELPLVAIHERARPRDVRVRDLRQRLARAFGVQGARLKPGERTSLQREAIKRIIRVEDCEQARKLEYACLPHPRLYPGMPLLQLAKIDRFDRDTIRETRQIIDVWKELRLVLAAEIEASGRLALRKDRETGAVFICLNTIQPINDQWQVPTFIMDATLPKLPILQTWYPNVELVADINVRAPHAQVRQLLGAPVTKAKLKRHDEGSEVEKRNAEHRRELLHYILQRWLECGCGETLVVAQKEYADWLRAAALPDTIHVAHYHAVSGLDRYKDVRLLICVGRTAPTPLVMESAAGALSGEAPETVTGPGDWWYPRQEVELAPGMVVRVDRHPDPLVEALRWQACEGGILQAIGRARAINRTAANPVDIDILADVVLPIEIKTVERWQRPSPLVVMLSQGLMLTSAADMARAWPDVWANERAAQRCLEAARIPTNPYSRFLYRDLSGFESKNPMISVSGDFRHFRYKLAENRKWRDGYFDPAKVLNLQAELEAKLGPIAHIELTELRVAA